MLLTYARVDACLGLDIFFRCCSRACKRWWPWEAGAGHGEVDVGGSRPGGGNAQPEMNQGVLGRSRCRPEGAVEVGDGHGGCSSQRWPWRKPEMAAAKPDGRRCAAAGGVGDIAGRGVARHASLKRKPELVMAVGEVVADRQRSCSRLRSYRCQARPAVAAARGRGMRRACC
jgi:hypothetical protein